MLGKRETVKPMASYAATALLLLFCAVQLSYGQGKVPKFNMQLSLGEVHSMDPRGVTYFIERICQHKYLNM